MGGSSSPAAGVDTFVVDLMLNACELGSAGFFSIRVFSSVAQALMGSCLRS